MSLTANLCEKSRRAPGRAHVPPTKLFRRLAVNKTIVKPRVAAATGAQYLYIYYEIVHKVYNKKKMKKKTRKK